MLSSEKAREATAKFEGPTVVITKEEFDRRAKEAAAIAPKDFKLYRNGEQHEN